MGEGTTINLGEQRFDRLIEENKFYIDKTSFIREWWEYGAVVTLITRLRRFGKTLNMSMIDCFFSNKHADRGDLFEHLSIWKDEKYRKLQGTYPVIFLSFANIKAAKYKDMEFLISKVISDLYEQNRYLLEGDLLSESEKEYYRSIRIGMNLTLLEEAVHSMTGFMQRYYGRDVIVLLDEYDTPMQEAWQQGYWDDAVRLFSVFLTVLLRQIRIFAAG